MAGCTVQAGGLRSSVAGKRRTSFGRGAQRASALRAAPVRLRVSVVSATTVASVPSRPSTDRERARAARRVDAAGRRRIEARGPQARQARGLARRCRRRLASMRGSRSSASRSPVPGRGGSCSAPNGRGTIRRRFLATSWSPNALGSRRPTATSARRTETGPPRELGVRPVDPGSRRAGPRRVLPLRPRSGARARRAPRRDASFQSTE